MTIVLYDIPSLLPGKAWSPNTWKARVVLNYKGIPYRTEWVEFPDIEPLSKKLGIEPTHHSSDGSPLYTGTLPAIHDPSTGVYIADSTAIAKYLEKTYPNTPSVFPNETIGLQKAFEATFVNSLEAVWSFIIPTTNFKLNPVSEEYYRRTKEISFGQKLEDVVPTGNARTEEWGRFEKGLASVYTYLVLTDTKKGPYILGDTISWSDLVLFSFIYWFKLIWGENSKEWKDIASWNGGRWEAHIDALKKYHTVKMKTAYRSIMFRFECSSNKKLSFSYASAAHSNHEDQFEF